MIYPVFIFGTTEGEHEKKSPEDERNASVLAFRDIASPPAYR